MSGEQIDFIKSKEASTKARLLKSIGSDGKRDTLSQSFISLIDVIAFLNITSGKLGDKPLTSEVIMAAVAEDMNLPFMKIDPLKLDSDVVTRFFSKLYAIRHQMVPVDFEDNRLTIATSNPFHNEGLDGVERTTDYDKKSCRSVKG